MANVLLMKNCIFAAPAVERVKNYTITRFCIARIWLSLFNWIAEIAIGGGWALIEYNDVILPV